MNLTIGRKVAIGFAIALAALLTIGVLALLNLRDLDADSLWVAHTYEVEAHIQSLSDGITREESSARGYALSPSEHFRGIANSVRVSVLSDIRLLRQLVSDNPVQEANLDRLEPLIAARLDLLKQLMGTRDQSGGVGNMGPLVTQGEDIKQGIKSVMDDMISEEEWRLKIRRARQASEAEWTDRVLIGGTILAFLLVCGAGVAVTRSIVYPLRVLGAGADRIGAGDYAHRVVVRSKDEVAGLAAVFNQMAAQVEERQGAQEASDWLKSGLARFATLFQGRRNEDFVCHSILAELAGLIGARHSVLYIPDRESPDTRLLLRAGYAAEGASPIVAAGEGLVGQCLLTRQRMVLHELPANYVRINSALGEARPRSLIVQPALFEGEVKAVLELASLQEFTPLQVSFLEQLAASIGVVLHTIEGAARTEELLQQAQNLSADLKARQSELSIKNEQLEIQTARLRSSELQLQEQQEELKQTNEELEQTNEEMQQTNEEMSQKVSLLAAQKKEMERTNHEIQLAREEVEQKAEEIARASRYKSEFLANMSHELRTPLNSLLILSKILSDNAQAHLDAKEIQYAKTIYTSGNDLLELINEILDLSKIESGAVEIEANESPLSEIRDYAEQNFRHVAEARHLDFSVELAADTPASIQTDVRRLEQILKNLLSNAFKFTERGSVKLKISPATSGWASSCETLNAASGVIAFAVTDSGIGIPEEKQKLIFEAFQQADSGTARKYGGTGLGLSISRELVSLFGGTLVVESTEGQGSTFTLYVPTKLPQASKRPESGGKAAAQKLTRERVQKDSPPAEPASTPSSDDDGMEDDRAALAPGDQVLLIIEDDRNFARIVMDFAREKRFKVVVARNAAQGIAWARHTNPSAITLDLHLPDKDGWLVLDQLKHDPKTRHIPIHVISVDGERDRSLRLGAVSCFQKPITKEALDSALSRTLEFINRPLKNLLIIEDNSVQRESLIELIGNGDVKSTAVGTAAEAFRAMDATRFDCVVLDLGLPDMSGLELIREIHRRHGAESPPVIVYTGKELTREEETELRLISESIVIKNVRSPERLLDETALFLHRVQTKLPEPQRRMIEQGQKSESILAGRKVLVVDDDVRNIFAITSALEASQMQVIYAESGQAGIDLLQSQPDVEAVLMDVMMPGMDGFETTRRIRQIEKFKKLPIISVTAKAMKGDREKCLEAGASDYVTKPVDMDQLRSLLRVWLYR